MMLAFVLNSEDFQRVVSPTDAVSSKSLSYEHAIVD